MKTYQDFLDIGTDEKTRMDFIQTVIQEHKSSQLYKTALEAEMYYNGENPTINKYEKILYDLAGRAHMDMWSANHKIASRFFGFAVDQETSYLLGNGVTFKNKQTKGKLETPILRFDSQVQLAGQLALIGGVSYGLWNLDHIDVFSVKEFIPLFDEENGAIKAGVRFWQIDDSKPLRATLYELDGYTDYIRRKGEDMQILTPKRTYKIFTGYSEIDGAKIYGGENYPDFPIVPLYNNDKSKSELCGKRNTIDALDLANSGMVNNVDEGNLIYWVINNAAGMDDLDDQQFLERIKTMHVVHTDNGATAEPHSIEAPFTGTQTTIDTLYKQLYTDFQCFDSSAVSAGNQTATAIRASYVPLDLKCDKFERQVTKFINGILSLAGIDDEPSYTRNQIINKQEEMQTLLLSAQYMTEDYITRKALTILGDPDMAEKILNQKDADDLNRFDGTVMKNATTENAENQEQTNTEIGEE